ncbi:MAG: hypothetical protein JXA25_08620 [Anaerolineales bacterium]|nr:hypothetical protein [Anaerolineales bacterium]
MVRLKLIKRLRSLRNLELFNIFFLPACLYVVLSIREITNWQPYAVSMASICVLLVQGTVYWHLKLESVRRQKTLSYETCRTFAFLKKANLLLFTVYPLLCFPGKVVPTMNYQVSFWSNLLYVFAILEYVNYYHYQLSHDNKNDLRYLLSHKRLRRSPLWKDLHRCSNV